MGPHKQPALSMHSPAPAAPALSTSVISKLLSMTTTLSRRQPAASSSVWVLQRRSLNVWPEGDGVRGRGAHTLAVSTLDLVCPEFPDPGPFPNTCRGCGQCGRG